MPIVFKNQKNEILNFDYNYSPFLQTLYQACEADETIILDIETEIAEIIIQYMNNQKNRVGIPSTFSDIPKNDLKFLSTIPKKHLDTCIRKSLYLAIEPLFKLLCLYRAHITSIF